MVSVDGWDGDKGMWGWLGMDSKFAGMDGDRDKSSSLCRSLSYSETLKSLLQWYSKENYRHLGATSQPRKTWKIMCGMAHYACTHFDFNSMKVKKNIEVKQCRLISISAI